MADITVTATSVTKDTTAGANVQTGSGIAGETITAGQPLYLDTSVTPNVLKKADANASVLTKEVVGIALNGGSVNQVITYVKSGRVNIGATMTAGASYFLSATAGGICPVGDLATGMWNVLLGTAYSATVLEVSIVIGKTVQA